MEIVWPLNRSRIYDTYFSLYRAIRLGGKCPRGNVRIPLNTHVNSWFTQIGKCKNDCLSLIAPGGKNKVLLANIFSCHFFLDQQLNSLNAFLVTVYTTICYATLVITCTLFKDVYLLLCLHTCKLWIDRVHSPSEKLSSTEELVPWIRNQPLATIRRTLNSEVYGRSSSRIPIPLQQGYYFHLDNNQNNRLFFHLGIRLSI